MTTEMIGYFAATLQNLIPPAVGKNCEQFTKFCVCGHGKQKI